MPGSMPSNTTSTADPRRALRVLLAAALACGGAHAEPPAAPAEPARIEWSRLAPAEQGVLAPMQAQWSTLAPRQQQRLRDVAARWQAAPPLRRALIERRIARWAALSPAQRGDLAARYEAFSRLPPEQQQDLREAFRRFRALPPEQRAALRERYDAMSPEERSAFVAGVQAERRSGGWQRLLADVPPAERPALRAMWQSLTLDQRHALRHYARGLSVDARADLRKRLLAMTPAQRDEYIAKLSVPP